MHSLQTSLHKKKRGPQWLMVTSFAVAISLGAVVLTLPISHTADQPGNWMTSLFLATSATCVTGLTPVTIVQHFSLFGQGVLILLVQLGGLGIMTLGTFFFELLGRRLSITDEQVLMNSLATNRTGYISSLLWRAVLFTAFWEVAGAAVLTWRFFYVYGFDVSKAVYYGVFHAISAFCNAGFALFPDSLESFAGDPWLLAPIAILVLMGGLGFIVHMNLISLAPWRRDRLARGRLTLHSRIVLWGTLVLVLFGTLSFFALEIHGVWGDLSAGKRWWQSLFHAITFRTSGFTAVNTVAMNGVSKLVTIVLMFIGGAPGSTAGGIKVTTAVVLAATMVAMIRHREETEFSHRTVPQRIVRKAIVITFMGVLLAGLAAVLLHFTESGGAVAAESHTLSLNLLFESVSAFATVGLSQGTTPQLSGAGQGILIVCMFAGRLGPLTLALTMGGMELKSIRRYPEEDVVVG